jgi:hypothetical protein
MRGAFWTGSLLPVGGVSARRLRIERFAVGGPMLELCGGGGVGWEAAALGCEARQGKARGVRFLTAKLKSGWMGVERWADAAMESFVLLWRPEEKVGKR